MPNASAATDDFSLTQAREIVRDLFTADERIYWLDFLTTIALGQAMFGLIRHLHFTHFEPLWLRLALQVPFFAVQCACFFRAVMFIHEIVHLPERKFRAFRVAWNLLCGIPFLIPSFTYYTHLDHHRRQSFGTDHDGEYLPLARMAPSYIALYLSQCLFLPLLVVLRFAVLTPFLWFCPPLRRWIYGHASSLVMDPTYVRPYPTAAALRYIRLQELSCFLFAWGCAIGPPLLLGRWPLVLLVHGYLTAAVLIFMNCLRTLASHRWWSDGREQTFVEQMLDSVTLASDSLFAVIINPVGLRFHATHHLFPSMPYHNLRAAHKRLLAHLPGNSPYRRTMESSLWTVVINLWQRAADHERRAHHEQPAANLLPGGG